MAKGWLAYDLQRIATLRQQIQDAIADLDGVSSDDPMAAPAVATARRISFQLNTTWLPHLARIEHDTSVTTWDSELDLAAAAGATPAAMSRGQPAASGPGAVIDEMTGLLEGVYEGDPAAVARLRERLEEHSDDPEVMAAFLGELGVEGWFDLIMVLGGYDTHEPGDATTCVEILTQGAQFVGPQDGFTAEALVDVSIDRMSDGSTHPHADVSSDPFSVVAVIGSSPFVPAGFRTQLARETTRREMEYEDESGLGGPWIQSVPWTGLGWATDVDLQMFAADPVAGILSLLTDHPEEARAFYADADLARHVWVEHDHRDGYTGLFGSWEAACAGPDLNDHANPPTAGNIHDANIIATQGVAWLEERAAAGNFNPAEVSDEASVSAANVTTTHMIAIEHAVLDTTPGVIDPADPQLAEVPHNSLPPGTEAEVASFSASDAELLVQSAASSDGGVEVLRQGTLIFHANTAAGTADIVVANMGDSDFNPTATIEGAMERSGLLDGWFIETIFNHQEGEAGDEHASIEFWVGAVSDGLSFGLKKVPILNQLTAAIPSGEDWLIGTFADHQEQVVAEANAHAQQSAGSISFTYLAAMVDAGLIDPPATASGEMPATYEEYVALDEATQDDFEAQAAMYQSGDIVTVDVVEILNAIKLQQAEIYDSLD